MPESATPGCGLSSVGAQGGKETGMAKWSDGLHSRSTFRDTGTGSACIRLPCTIARTHSTLCTRTALAGVLNGDQSDVRNSEW